MKIFIDDERMPLPDTGEWVIVRDPSTACAVIYQNAAAITHISFDNDLGFEMEGRDILRQLLGTPVVRPASLPRLEAIIVHSANTVANSAMVDLARDAQAKGVLRAEVAIIRNSALDVAYPTISSHHDESMKAEDDRLRAIEMPRDDEASRELDRLEALEHDLGIVMEGNGTCRLP